MGDKGFYAIVLAAGAGSRFGGGKLLAPYAGGVLVEAAIRAALAAPVERVMVVVQPDAVTASWAKGERVTAVPCADWAEGMAASLRAGIVALPADAEGAFVFLGDMPRIPSDIPPKLVEAVRSGAPAALPTCEGRDGHPVLFAARLFPDLLTRKGDQGARRIVAALGDQVARTSTPDPGVLIDIDRPEDLDRLQAASPAPIPR